ncbi:MAG: AAA family ATPase [Chloroflexales bacterium]|nr:AAA family ATPase [Chloroflexales bacterium]
MDGVLKQSVVCPVFIGHTTHVATLRALFQRAKGHGGQTVVLTGEAGVGKTRLVAQAQASAENQGFHILQGGCFQTDRASPYGPLLDLLRNRFASHPVAMLLDAFGPAAPLLAPLLPDLVPPLPDPTAALPGLLAPEPHQLIGAFTRFFVRQAAAQPLLVIVEDLHWSDDRSLECLYHLARHCPQHPLVLLLTYRSDEVPPRLQHWLAQLDRERLAQELALPCLTRSEVEAMLRAIFALARPVRVEFLDALYRLTGGNPFFIEEVLTSLIAAGDIFYRDGVWDRKPLDELRIPRSVQDAVQQRAARLSAPAQALLRLAAVVGRRFDFAFLQALTAQDEPRLLALLHELVAAGLVVEATADQFAFRHALTCEAITASLLTRERQTLHQTILVALEQQDAAALTTRLPELAHHAYQAGRWGQTLAYANSAGERALALYAPRAAIEQFTYARKAAQHLGLPTPLGVLHGCGQAYEWVGDFMAARQDYEAALAQAHAAADRRSEWQVLLDLGLLWAGRDYGESHTYYQQALDLARTLGQPTLLAHSLNRLGNWYTNADQPAAGQHAHQEALSLFDTLGDQRGRAATLDLLGIAACARGDLIRMDGFYRQAITLFEGLDERRGLVGSLATRAAGGGILHSTTVAPATPSPEAVAAGERALRLAREIGWRAGEAYTQTLLGSHLATQGAYGRALQLVQHALAIAEEIEHRAWIAQAHHTLGALYLDLLALPAAQHHLEHALALAQALGSTYRLRVVTGSLALAAIAARQLDHAERALDAVLDSATPMETLGQRLCWSARAELALTHGAPDQTRAIAERLIASVARRGAGDPPAVPYLALLRGTALAALGRTEEAQSTLVAAREGALRQGTQPLLWRVEVVLGHLYHAEHHHAEAERSFDAAAASIAASAASIADDQVRDTFRQAANARLPTPPPWRSSLAPTLALGALSPREREVADLIAQGLPNGAIAERLVLSKRTIETHVGSILGKLGFTTRAQIIAWVLAEGRTSLDDTLPR